MAESTEEAKEMGSKISHNRDDLLVLGIDQNGRIVQFNTACEQIAGYNKNDVLNQLFDFLVPERYFERLGNVLDSARKNKLIHEFKLPLLTTHGQEVMVSWSSFPVKDDGGTVGEVVFVGKVVLTIDSITDSLFKYTKNDVESKVDVAWANRMGKNRILLKAGDKKIFFRRKPSMKPIEAVDQKPSMLPTEEQQQEKLSTPKPREEIETTIANETYATLMKHYNYENLLKNYNDLTQALAVLEKRNKELEKENKKTQKTLNGLRTRWTNKKKDEQLSKTTVMGVFAGKKRKEEFEHMICELDERKSELINLEAQLAADEKSLNEQRNIFTQWREKLELLEHEIESRRLDLVEQEHLLSDRFVSSMGSKITADGEMGGESRSHHDVLDKIPECAAIIHRGILKQVNPPFAQLLGYKIDELVEKSLLDFVVPEGLLEIERYYFNRLKGEDVSTYDTIFLTQDNKKMPVVVSVKPVSYKGENADIAVVRLLTNMGQEDND
jgi:PAS domain S-box-containing protein